MPSKRLLVATFIILAMANGCSRQRENPIGSRTSERHPIPVASEPLAIGYVAERVVAEPLPNVIRIHPRILSGGLPVGAESFRTLRELGVKTIISVDGAKPNLESATVEGIRYVHLPIGYNGIEDNRAAELARAVRDLPGPIYIHCHHGKHRSPTAAAVAAIGAGLIAPECSLAVLTAGGTNPNYRGLYQAAKQARRIDENVLDAANGEFPETAKLPALAAAMVELEHTFDRISQLADNQWEPLPDHPDLEPAHEALQLREHFTEMKRMDRSQEFGDDFLALLEDSQSESERLETMLRTEFNDNKSDSRKKDFTDKSLKTIRANCQSCHEHFRDIPLATDRHSSP